MTLDTWMSIGFGVAIGLFHALASLGVSHFAGRFASQEFLTVYLGGMVMRLVLTAMLLVLVLVLAPLEPASFLIAFIVVFIAGLAWEVMQLHRRAGDQAEK
jgi:urocanate hydratase